jgi:hypothetical protein
MSRDHIPKHHAKYLKAYLSLNTLQRKLEEGQHALWDLNRITDTDGATPSEDVNANNHRSQLAIQIADQATYVMELIQKHPLTDLLNKHAKRGKDDHDYGY